MNILKILKNQINIFKYFYREPEYFPGAILPSADELGGVVKFEETVASINPVTWKQLDITKIPKYPIYSQNGSGSCVAMSVALIATILYKIRTGTDVMFSPAWIYKRRTAKGAAGMVGVEAFKIASEGICLNELMPSMDLSEAEINIVKEYPEYESVAKVFALSSDPILLPIKDIDAVASVMQTTGKPVNVWFEFAYNEWQSIPIIKTQYPSIRHSVVAIDYGMYENEKSIVIQESWGVNSTSFGSVRIIKESFYRQRNIFAAYPRRFKFESTGNTEIYDGSIISFQKCMQSIALFPVGVSFVAVFGPLTKKACIAFQAQQNLPQSGIIDQATDLRLRALFI